MRLNKNRKHFANFKSTKRNASYYHHHHHHNRYASTVPSMMAHDPSTLKFIKSFPCNYSLEWGVQVLFSFYRKWNWGTERSGDLSKGHTVTEPGSSHSRFCLLSTVRCCPEDKDWSGNIVPLVICSAAIWTRPGFRLEKQSPQLSAFPCLIWQVLRLVGGTARQLILELSSKHSVASCILGIDDAESGSSLTPSQKGQSLSLPLQHCWPISGNPGALVPSSFLS